MKQQTKKRCMRCHDLVPENKLCQVIHDRLWCVKCVLEYDGHVADIVVSLPAALLHMKRVASA